MSYCHLYVDRWSLFPYIYDMFPKWIHLYTENASFVWCLHCLYRYSKTSKCVFSIMHFLAKIHVSVPFLGHFLAELIEICCGSLLNSILKTNRRKFLKTLWILFTPKNLKCCQFCWCFSHKKRLKNLIFNKTKNTSVRFFIYMSSRCVQNVTAFEEVVWKLGVPWWVP